MNHQPFKKDSRFWLHKNSKRKHCGNEPTKYYVDPGRLIMRQPLHYEDTDSPPYITGADGRVYKKDSRTWLHKSSVRTNGREKYEGIQHVNGAKNQRRMWDVMLKVKEIAADEKLQMDSIRAQDSSELIRGMINVGKRKKNSPRGRNGLASMSHRDIHIVEECEDSRFSTYHYCHDKKPRVRYVKGSYSDHDNTNDESSSESDGSNDEFDHEDRKHQVLKLLCECPLSHRRNAVLNCNGCDNLQLCRSNGSIELTQDGLNAVRDISREMHTDRRPSYLTDNSDHSLIQEAPNINHLDLSTGGLYSSKSSLNVIGANLSDECVTANEEIPRAESDYQLSQATEGLNVQSPTTVQRRCLIETDDAMTNE